jgi:ATPase subunit of ABC transporter with duplicated ATPase domains
MPIFWSWTFAGALVVVCHDRRFAERFAVQRLVLENGDALPTHLPDRGKSVIAV